MSSVKKSKIQLCAESIAKTIVKFRMLNEGEKLDALSLADDLCDDFDRPIDLIPMLEALVRMTAWTRGNRDAKEQASQ